MNQRVMIQATTAAAICLSCDHKRIEAEYINTDQHTLGYKIKCPYNSTMEILLSFNPGEAIDIKKCKE